LPYRQARRRQPYPPFVVFSTRSESTFRVQ
jgi:hypothetical protein